MYSSSTTIRGQSRGSPDAIYQWAKDRGAQRLEDLRLYLDTVYQLAPTLGIRAEIVVAQSHLEADGWRSYWWRERRNPAGLGITGYAPQDDLSHTFATGDEAAIAHVAHLGLYTGADVPPDWAHLDPRWDAAIEAGYHGIATTLDDLTNRWAIDPDYGSKIASRLTLMDSAGLFARIVEDAPMTHRAHQWPGLDRPVYLPDWIRVDVRIAPNKGNWRRGPKTNRHVKTTWHDTGNPSTDAEAEYRWAANGRTGAGVGGYNGVFDSDQVIIMQPFDEEVYAAGTPTGNATSYHFEQALRDDFARTLQVGYALHGGIIAAKGWSADTALVQHHYWYGKHCPAQIRNRGIWSQVVRGVTEAAEAARLAANPTTPAPVYEKPVIIPELDAISKGTGIAPAYVDGGGARWFWVGDRVRVVKATGRFQRASTDAARVGPDLKAGEEFDVDWITDYAGALWYYTPWGTRINAADVVRISDTKGEQEAA